MPRNHLVPALNAKHQLIDLGHDLFQGFVLCLHHAAALAALQGKCFFIANFPLPVYPV